MHLKRAYSKDGLVKMAVIVEDWWDANARGLASLSCETFNSVSRYWLPTLDAVELHLLRFVPGREDERV